MNGRAAICSNRHGLTARRAAAPLVRPWRSWALPAPAAGTDRPQAVGGQRRYRGRPGLLGRGRGRGGGVGGRRPSTVVRVDPNTNPSPPACLCRPERQTWLSARAGWWPARSDEGKHLGAWQPRPVRPKKVFAGGHVGDRCQPQGGGLPGPAATSWLCQRGHEPGRCGWSRGGPSHRSRGGLRPSRAHPGSEGLRRVGRRG